MKEKVLTFMSVSCSLVLMIISYSKTNKSVLLEENQEALSSNDYYEITCGRDEGYCWAGEIYYTLGIKKCRCPYWTGSMTSLCKKDQWEISTMYDEWYVWAKNNGVL